jgi:hypothetical protein
MVFLNGRASISRINNRETVKYDPYTRDNSRALGSMGTFQLCMRYQTGTMYKYNLDHRGAHCAAPYNGCGELLR